MVPAESVAAKPIIVVVSGARWSSRLNATEGKPMPRQAMMKKTAKTPAREAGTAAMALRVTEPCRPPPE